MLKNCLIGLGEFSHGIQNSWEFRFKLLKQAMSTTDKKITIFNEQSAWSARNVMRTMEPVLKEEEAGVSKGYTFGKLWRYIGHASESKIVVKILKYIIANRDRITLIGVDNDKLARDRHMFKVIQKKMNRGHVNFFWAHNFHVDDRSMSDDTYEWIKKTHPNEKWSAGHYLREWLGKKYCIILSQAYTGVNRFNGFCKGRNCAKRTWQLEYMYHKFTFAGVKKYVSGRGSRLLKQGEYDGKFMEFSNSYYVGNAWGHQTTHKSCAWDFVIFWNTVKELH